MKREDKFSKSDAFTNSINKEIKLNYNRDRKTNVINPHCKFMNRQKKVWHVGCPEIFVFVCQNHLRAK